MTTWNPSDKHANISLSGGDLIATATGNGGLEQGVRTTTSQNSGKHVIAITGDLRSSTSFNYAGMSRAGAVYDGSTTTSLYINRDGSYFYFHYNGSTPQFDDTSPDFTGTDEVRFFLDSDNDLVYVSLNGNNLFGGDPSAGTGGQSISDAAWFAHCSIAVSGRTVTVNPSPTSLPGGWSAWDAAATGIPNKIYQTNFTIKRASYY